MTNFSLIFMEIIFRKLEDCYYGVATLTREQDCNLQLMIGLTSAVLLGSESRGTHDHILLSQFWDSPPTWRARFLYSFSAGTGWPSYNPGHWILFL
jgi:hypothetical protein